MQIHGPTHVHGPQPVNAPHRTNASQSTARPEHVSTVDQLDISTEAELISRIHDVPDIRSDRVQEIKAQLASGAYETGDKLDIAIERLLDEIG